MIGMMNIIIFIYNSFPKEVMREVTDRLHESALRNPRKIVILYLYPEYPDELVADGYFCLIEKESRRKIRNGMHIYVNEEYKCESIFM